MSDVALSDVPSREQIEALQREVMKLPQIEPETKHYFTNTGLYAREVTRKAGTLVIGKVHKKEHFFVVLTGEMTLWTEAGMKKVKAPFMWHSMPGTKRVTFAHTDSTAITFHVVTSRDLEEVERELVEDDPASLYGPGNTVLQPALEHEA